MGKYKWKDFLYGDKDYMPEPLHSLMTGKTIVCYVYGATEVAQTSHRKIVLIQSSKVLSEDLGNN